MGNRAHKYVPVFLLAVISCCRVPSLIFHFQISTITRWMTDTMAKYQKITDYQAKYLDVSKEIIEVLEKSDRQMEYLQYDIKAERCRIDSTSGTVTYLPSREDSYERLLEGNKQFPSDDEDVDDAAIKAVMIEKMLTCLKRLSTEEQELITALFFKSKSEHQVSREASIPQRTIHDRKIKILAKLKRLMNE